MDSILTSIKLLLGIHEDNNDFDAAIIMHINSVLFVLSQVGVGPPGGYRITGEENTWNDYIPEEERVKVGAVETYIYAKVKLVFDPPTNSALLTALKETIAEFEWRLNIAPEINYPTGEEVL